MVTLDRNIYVIGPHSSGKTTLCKALREAFGAGTPSISEVARGVVSRGGYTAEEIETNPSRCLLLQREILQAQFEAEETYHRTGTRFISDRSAVNPIVYATRYVNHVACQELCESREWQNLKKVYQDQSKSLLVLNMKFWEKYGTRLVSRDWDDWWQLKVKFLHTQGFRSSPSRPIASV